MSSTASWPRRRRCFLHSRFLGRVWFRVSARYDRDKPKIPPNGLRPTRDVRLEMNAGGRFPKRGLGGAQLKRGRAFVCCGTKHALNLSSYASEDCTSTSSHQERRKVLQLLLALLLYVKGNNCGF